MTTLGDFEVSLSAKHRSNLTFEILKIKNLTSFMISKPTRERVIGKSELNDKLVYCVKWDGCKTTQGNIIDEKYEWMKPCRELNDMIIVFEALGPAIKWNDTIEATNEFQHFNQEPIQACEIKDLSMYPKIELLVGDKKYEFYEMPQRFQYRGVWRELRQPYFMCRTGVIWQNIHLR